MGFTAQNGTSTNLRTQVLAYALGATVDYDLPEEQANTCGRLLDASCPLDIGEDATFHFEFYIDHIYPTIPLVLQVSILDGDDTVSCFRMDGNVSN